MERARQLDPLSLIIAADNGAILLFSRQYDRAIDQFRALREMEPNFPRGRLLIPASVEKGLLRDALAEVQRWRHHDDTPWSYVMLAYVSGRSAHYAKAKIALQQLEQLDAHRSLDPLSFSIAYIGLGDKEKALVFLEKAYEEHSSGLTALKVDPTCDPLRGESRFQALVQHIGLAQ